MPTFAARLIAWQKEHGRHHLPWQNSTDPYRIWLSEIMLQQTQVATVIPYYRRFLARYPDIAALAAAEQEHILSLWSGLGYYARARNLHRAARQICGQHHGCFPRTRQQLETLSGIGRSTAAAIAVFAYGDKEAILDGNVKRILCRHRAIESEPGTATDRQLWQLAEQLLPDGADALRTYTQGLMDLGSSHCRRLRPECDRCPLRHDCRARRQGTPEHYPRKKKNNVKAQKNGHFLYCRHHGRILLQQRPQNTLWGGLWTLPWFDSTEELHAFAQQHRITLQSTAPVRLIHHFTHYTLRLHTYPADSKHPRLPAAQHWRWHDPADTEHSALPAPIKILLQQIPANPEKEKNTR